MIGLPNETKDDVINTVNFLNKLDIQGIKIHSTYVVKNTKLEKMYISGEYIPLTMEKYLDQLALVISHIKEDVIIHRVSGDAPKDILVAPTWNTHKKLIINGLDKLLIERNITQGCDIKNDN